MRWYLWFVLVVALEWCQEVKAAYKTDSEIEALCGNKKYVRDIHPKEIMRLKTKSQGYGLVNGREHFAGKTTDDFQYLSLTVGFGASWYYKKVWVKSLAIPNDNQWHQLWIDLKPTNTSHLDNWHIYINVDGTNKVDIDTYYKWHWSGNHPNHFTIYAAGSSNWIPHANATVCNALEASSAEIRPSQDESSEIQENETLSDSYSQEVENQDENQNEQAQTDGAAPSPAAKRSRTIPAKTMKIQRDNAELVFYSTMSNRLKAKSGKSEESDPDKLFLLSLIPEFKILSSQDKTELKIIIYNSINRFRQQADLASRSLPSAPPQYMPGPSSPMHQVTNSYNYPHHQQTHHHPGINQLGSNSQGSPVLTERQTAQFGNQVSRSVGAAHSLSYGASSNYNPQGTGSVLTELQTVVPFSNTVSQSAGTSRTDSGATSPTLSVGSSVLDDDWN